MTALAHLGRLLGTLATALALVAAPATAKRTISYTGTAVFQSYSTLGFPIAGLVDGSAGFTGTFYYDDALELIGATTSVGGIARGHFTCPVWIGFCPALALSATSINSGVATTPEDGMSLGVTSPTGFGGLYFLATRRVAYDVVPGDDTSAFVTWSPYDGPLGFAYSVGTGTITRVESAVPEPASWGLLIAGFALTGSAARRARAIASRP